MELKKDQIVRLKKEFQTPRCKKGHSYALYKITKINRVNVKAINLGTFIMHDLRIDQLEVK